MEKIAIPVTGGTLSAHFGHCEQFAIYTIKDKEITEETMLTPPPHEPGLLPAWLREQGATSILAGGMGSRAQDLFTEAGISVVYGVPAGDLKGIVDAYLAGTLQSGSNACDH